MLKRTKGAILSFMILILISGHCGILSVSPSITNSVMILSSSDSSFSDTECTSVIVTGSAAKDGRAILMKNRDSSQTHNIPVYHPATSETYAFVAINSMWMGMNEKGLAVMNTAMPSLAEGSDIGTGNGPLNRLILEQCENVSEVIARLFAKTDPLVSDDLGGAVATCVGVIDRFGNGAFLEISNTRVSVEYVQDGYQSRANHPRTYSGLASEPYGRDQYALDALDEIYSDKGVISYQDVAQIVSRNVRGKESDTSLFSISGEICNVNTVSAMVAVSGDERYEGALNAVWFSCGQVPMVSVFVPTMVGYGVPSSIWGDMVSYTQEKDNFSRPTGSTYDPSRVQEIQEYAFAAENYTFTQYDRFIEQVPSGFSDTDLNDIITDFVDLTTCVSIDMYINETADLPDYAVPFNVIDTSSTTTTTQTTGSTTTGNSNANTNPSNIAEFDMMEAVVGFSIGLVAIVVLFVVYSRIRYE